MRAGAGAGAGKEESARKTGLEPAARREVVGAGLRAAGCARFVGNRYIASFVLKIGTAVRPRGSAAPRKKGRRAPVTRAAPAQCPRSAEPRLKPGPAPLFPALGIIIIIIK